MRYQPESEIRRERPVNRACRLDRCQTSHSPQPTPVYCRAEGARASMESHVVNVDMQTRERFLLDRQLANNFRSVAGIRVPGWFGHLLQAQIVGVVTAVVTEIRSERTVVEVF